jgi:hypothetical protein
LITGHKVRQAQEEPSNINSFTDLVEISMWLGTYRERMRLAGPGDQQELADNAHRSSDGLVQRSG